MQELRLNRPHVIVMVGLPGSGKSFFARQFADTFNAPYVDGRAIAALCDDTKHADQIAQIMCEEIAKTKQTFVYEGDTETRASRTEFAKWARAHGYQPLLVWVQTDQSTAESRSLKMYSMSSNEYAALSKRFSAPHPTEAAVVISGKHTYATQARVVLTKLSGERAPQTIATGEPRPTSHPGRITVQ